MTDVAATLEDPSLRRVLSLPRREPLDANAIALISSALRLRSDPRCPDGPGTADDPCPRCGGTGWIMLKQAQAEALREVYDLRGLFGPMGVGTGKTLVTLLAPALLGAQRPVMMVPAQLREKTRRDYARYRLDWHVRLPELLGYEEMGRPDRERRLYDLQPDLLLLDEADNLRNRDSAVTRRVMRYVIDRAPVVVALSGTLLTDALMDAWHFALWSLGERAPLPLQQAEAERWATAVDVELGKRTRTAEGGLGAIPGGYHGWFRGSRGVVATSGSDCDASISIAPWSPPLPAALREAIDEVARTKLRPDGEPLDDWGLPDCLCQLAQGFYYVWDPMPPQWWIRPRRAWLGYARAVLDEHLPGLDSEGQLAQALDLGRAPAAVAPREGLELLTGWRAVKDRFVPNPVPIWLDDDPLLDVAAHVQRRRCIVWVRHVAAGERLAQYGLPYFGAGTDPEHEAERRKPFVASLQAHGVGQNLQAWDSMLFLTPPANADAWEQAIGREHRQGQRADHISVEYLATIPYHADVMKRVRAEARRITKANGFGHKLVLADWTE